MATSKAITATVTLTLALLFCRSSTALQLPGVKLSLPFGTLNYSGLVGVDIFAAKLNVLTIPDVSGLWSNVNYVISASALTSFKKPVSSVSLNVGSSLKWSLTGASATISGKWSHDYQLLIIKIANSGSFTATVSIPSVSVTVTLGVSKSGQPTVSATECVCGALDVSLQFSDGASFLKDLFAAVFVGNLKSVLESAVCDAATKTVNENLAGVFAKLDVRVPIDVGYLIDYSLISAPQIASGYLVAALKGEFFNKKDLSEAPFNPTAIASVATSRMATSSVSEYTLNTVAYVAFKQNLFIFTGNLGSVIPTIGSPIPGVSFQFNLRAIVAPTISISSSLITATIVADASIAATYPDSTVKTVLGIQLNITLSVTLKADGILLTATAITRSIEARVTSSLIGNIAAADLIDACNALVAKYVIPKLNAGGAIGLPVPHQILLNLKPLNVGLEVRLGVIVISADLSFL